MKTYRIRATKEKEIRDFYVVETFKKECCKSLESEGYKVEISVMEEK